MAQQEQGRRWEEVEPALSAATLETISSFFGFETMTPVQAASIPLMLTHRDVVAEACTGSGKTLAFVVAATELVLRSLRDDPTACTVPRCIAVSPTRELALQTERVFRPLCEAHKLGPPALATGGAAMKRGIEANVVVGTPGRLDDVLRKDRGETMVSRHVALLVLDEADTLLDLGFSDELRRIAGALPKQRRTCLFSATQTRAVAELARAGLRNPASVRVAVGNEEAVEGETRRKTPTELCNEYAIVESDEKLSLLMRVLTKVKKEAEKGERVLVFLDTCAAVEFFGCSLEAMSLRPSKIDEKIRCLLKKLPKFFSLHGRMTPKKRKAVYEKFLACAEVACLLCTDVAARGLDVPRVRLVVQYDPPSKADTFVHRAGRTARAGNKGSALIFLSPREDAFVQLAALRGAPLAEFPSLDDEEDPSDLAACLREELIRGCVADRALLEKGTRAFTSHIKAYLEHQLTFIFRFDRLDLAATARSYALLKLPEMPELRKARRLGQLKDSDFQRSDVRTGTIPFKDPKREEARLVRFEKTKLERVEKKEAMIQEAASSNVESEFAKKKKKKADEEAGKKKKRVKTQGRNARILEEWDDLAREELLAKKLRKGKITRDQYEAALRGEDEQEASDGGDDEDEDDEDDNKKKKKTANGGPQIDLAMQRRKNAKKQRGTSNKRQSKFKKT